MPYAAAGVSPEQKRKLGDWIARRRDELGISQDRLAANGGPSAETLRQWESGNIPDNPKLKTLEKLDAGLQWARGSARTVLIDGSEPSPTQPISEAPAILHPIDDKLVDHLSVSRSRIMQIIQLSTALVKAEPEKPEITALVNKLHLLTSELAIEALNQ
jgi:DNA-binding XRE family transcriptional regulator